MRSLSTAASGMAAQQTRLDTIGHNLANVNTTGFKAQNVQFKDMLYAQFEQKPLVDNIPGRVSGPGLAIGHGVLVNGIGNSFAQGQLQSTNIPLDLALEGNGFFTVGIYENGVQTGQGFTRAGSFKVGMDGQDAYLVDGQGNPVLDDRNNPINLTGLDIDSLQVDQKGNIQARRGDVLEDVATLSIVRVDNPETNLRPAGVNTFAAADGLPANAIRLIATLTPAEQPPQVRQYMVEMSNVDMAKSMTDMIVAQRLYSMNARSLQTADQMMGMANNLRSG
jgi:flagellar basal-body rod protein FlgG